MNTERTVIDSNTYHAMVTRWEDHIWKVDRFRSMREYYAHTSWDIDYDAHNDRWTIPAHQLDFFILAL